MNYGFYTSASGAFTQMARVDVLSNNLANVDTVAFKPLGISVRQRDAVRTEDGLQHVDTSALLERLGAGVMPTPTRISTRQGAVSETGNPLDVAVQGDGYFMVRIDDELQPTGLTRDGRMLIGPDGTLVQAGSGRPVLSPNGQRIELELGATPEIRGDGVISQSGVVVGQLGLVHVPEPGAMASLGGGIFHPSAQQMEQSRAASGLIRSHAVERSAVDAISTMMGITRASGSARSSLRVASTIDETMNQAINRLGRVS